MSKFFRNLLIIVAIFLVIAGAFTLFNTDNKNTQSVAISQVVDEINNSKVDRMDVSGDKINVYLKDGSQQTSSKEASVSIFTTLKEAGADPAKTKNLNIAVKDSSSSSFWISTILPFVIPFL